jgi:hypothetical protein
MTLRHVNLIAGAAINHRAALVRTNAPPKPWVPRPPQSQFWSMPEHYTGSVTLSICS